MDILAFDHPDLESLSIEVVLPCTCRDSERAPIPMLSSYLKSGLISIRQRNWKNTSCLKTKTVLVFEYHQTLFDEEFSPA